MAAKYAAVITYDNVKSFALAVAVKNSTGAHAASDSGGTTYASIGDINAAHAALIAAGYATQMTIYPSSLLSHAQADALALAGTL